MLGFAALTTVMFATLRVDWSGGATRAAAELHVTHSAVSRQVKALEASLGVRLFEGPRSRLQLTAAGRELLAGLTPGFDASARPSVACVCEPASPSPSTTAWP